jgi:hypothetical protein
VTLYSGVVRPQHEWGWEVGINIGGEYKRGRVYAGQQEVVEVGALEQGITGNTGCGTVPFWPVAGPSWFLLGRTGLYHRLYSL